MKYINSYNLCLLCCIVAGSAFAAPDDERFHLNAMYMFNATSDINTADIDFNGDGGFAGYVGYNIKPWLSVELGGVYFEPIESASRASSVVNQRTRHEVSGYSVGLRGVYSFYDLFDVWGGFGLYSWESTFNYQIDYFNFPPESVAGSDTNSSEDPYIRLGVTLPLTENLGLSAGLAQFELKDFFSNVPGGQENTNFRQRYIGLGIDYYF